MSDFFASIGEELAAFTAPEALAVILAVLYLLLAIRQNIWCWFCAGVSTAIFVYVYFDARLYMEAALNVFYFAMAVYGWYSWQHVGAEHAVRPVTRWPLAWHCLAVLLIAILSSTSGFLLDRYSDAAFPYLDSATTWSAIWATFLVARKVLENWWYWLVIDLASIGIYWSRDLELTALLFLVYVIMIPFGLVAWTRSMHGQRAAGVAA